MSGPLDSRRFAANFAVQVARLLRIVVLHGPEHTSTQAILAEFNELVNPRFELVPQLVLAQVGEHLFLNGEFVPLVGPTQEAAVHLRRTFKLLGVNELVVLERLKADDWRDLITRFTHALKSKKKLEASGQPCRVDMRVGSSFSPEEEVGDTRELVAEAYVHVATLIREARMIFERGGNVSVPAMRRAIYLLADVSRGHEDRLLALSRLPNGDGDVTLHSTAVAAMCLLMGYRLGLDRATLAGLVLSGVFHDLGRDDGERPRSEARVTLEELAGLRSEAALNTAIRIGQRVRSVEAIERVAVALEAPVRPRGDGEGLIPSMSARLVSVACAFETLMQPRAPLIGVRADQAMSMLWAQSDGTFDVAALGLLTSVVGVYPVGSMVELTGGLVGVVLATPDRPDRPTVKIVREDGRETDRVVELAAEDESLAIVRCFGASGAVDDVFSLLLA